MNALRDAGIPASAGNVFFRRFSFFARFIPASAGNGRAESLTIRPTVSVHPRVRGERRDSGRRRQARFIPASAGIGPARSEPRAGNGSTRVRGERTQGPMGRKKVGSSPRPRGTVAVVAMAQQTAVHPRVRGERQHRHRHAASRDGSSPRPRGTEIGVVAVIDHVGSSPRPRGTARRDRTARQAPRFIPASAGNGASSIKHRSTRFIPASAGNGRGPDDFEERVHPRVRGERRPPSHALSAVSRFIPASAGNGRSQTVCRPQYAVHPRVRGERLGCAVPRSPPRFIPASAGNGRIRRQGSSSFLRFIPASAGNGWI